MPKKSNIEKIRSIQKKKQASKKPEYSTKYFFKRYKKKEQGVKHPKLIINTIIENGTKKHIFMGFTESPTKGKKRRKNIQITNPKPKDARNAYLRKELRKDKTVNFEPLSNYHLHKEDEIKVDEFLNKKRNNLPPSH